MRDLLVIWDVTFLPGSAEQLERGLMGYVACTLNGGLRIDGLIVQMARDGQLALKFPSRTDRMGQGHPIIKPLGKHARGDVERQVFAELRRQGVLS